MNSIFPDILRIKANVGELLREARLQVGLKQSDLASAGGVARATQVGYEAGDSEPTTSYLRNVQQTSIDVPYVLFGKSTEEIWNATSGAEGIDWALMQSCHEDVEFFCMRFAPNCPQSYRWKMVAQIYRAISESNRRATPGQVLKNPLEQIQALWNGYENSAA